MTQQREDATMAEESELFIDTRRIVISQILDAFYAAFGKNQNAIERSSWGTRVTDESFGKTNCTYTYPPKQTRESYANDQWCITESGHWLYGVTYFIGREMTKGDGKKIIKIVIGNEKAPSYLEAKRVMESGTGFQATEYSYKETFQATCSDTVKLIANEHNNVSAFPLILRTIRDIPQPTK
jgi:hypothetical protein